MLKLGEQRAWLSLAHAAWGENGRVKKECSSIEMVRKKKMAKLEMEKRGRGVRSDGPDLIA